MQPTPLRAPRKMERDFSPASTCSLEGGELFLDMMSQPSRACAYFAHLCRLPLATRVTALNKKAQLDPSYPNPLRQVPCLRERDGFVLPESSAILKYLAARHGVPDHWYPSEPRARADHNIACTCGVARPCIVANKRLLDKRGARPVRAGPNAHISTLRAP